NQAFNALLFLYQEVLGIELPRLDALRARRPKRLPLVLSQPEVGQLLGAVTGGDGAFRLMAGILHASAMRIRVRNSRSANGRAAAGPLGVHKSPSKGSAGYCSRKGASQGSRLGMSGSFGSTSAGSFWCSRSQYVSWRLLAMTVL